MSKHKNLIRTTCPYCGVGCGVKVERQENGKVTISGDEMHPANYGRLCTKGRALGDTLDKSTRIAYPEVRGVKTQWRKATAYVAHQFQKIIENDGPDAIAFYVSGQLLTEDYYVANKLMKGFIGSGNIDTNSRLCMSSPVVAHKKAFGSDTVPVNYSDLEKADLVVLTGSNLAWCHPVLFQRLAAEKKARPALKIVVIDPRVTATSQLADLHLAIKSGTDLALFNGLLCYLVDQGAVDNRHFKPANLAKTVAAARKDYESLESLAELLAIDIVRLKLFFNWFAKHEKVVTVFSQGINQSTMGVDQASAIINCHLITNRIGRPGMGPFSITGQPNAMGGREVGGMATSLAAHLSFDDTAARQLVSKFWQTENLATAPGQTAVDIFDRVASGKIKAIWIMATNPAVTLPNSRKIHQALEKCPLVVVSESFTTSETTQYADVLFPATPWGEKSGTVTNAERRISRQRPFAEPYKDARPDWKIICQVAQAMGFTRQFAFTDESEIFAEHAQLTSLAAKLTGSLSLASLAGIDQSQYHSLLPFQWPQLASNQLSFGDIRVFKDGQFHTANGRPNMVPVCYRDRISEEQKHRRSPGDAFLKLNSGRSRDHWHTMTRTGLSPQLNGHTAEPFIWIHPDDAYHHQIAEGGIVELTNSKASVVRKVRISHQVQKGEIFSPMHWSSVNHSGGSINQLLGSARDPESSQPAFKHALIKIQPVAMQSRAVFLTRERIRELPCFYWTEQVVPHGFLYFIADDAPEEQLFERLADALMSQFAQNNQTAQNAINRFTSQAASQRRYSLIAMQHNKLHSYLASYSSSIILDADWLSQALAMESLSQAFADVFSTRPFQNQNNGSPLCLCLNINRQEVSRAARDTGELDQICEQTGAGKACGTCLGDLALALFGEKAQESGNNKPVMAD